MYVWLASGRSLVRSSMPIVVLTIFCLAMAAATVSTAGRALRDGRIRTPQDRREPDAVSAGLLESHRSSMLLAAAAIVDAAFGAGPVSPGGWLAISIWIMLCIDSLVNTVRLGLILGTRLERNGASTSQIR